MHGVVNALNLFNNRIRFMNLFDAFILGIVEGITEYLPISSTGHLILTSAALGLSGDNINRFEVVIQLGAIIAVLGLYKDRVFQIINGLLGKDKNGLNLLINLMVAFIPAAFLGFLFHSKIKLYLFNIYTVAGALAAGGVFMIFSDVIFKNQEKGKTTINTLSWKSALIIGIAQCFALFPGMSRSMSTILGGMFAGLNRKEAAEFSFLLALPTLGSACAYDLHKGGLAFINDIGGLNIITGLVVSAVVAAISIKFLVSWLTKHGLASFGWYRVVLAAAVFIFGKSGF